MLFLLRPNMSYAPSEHYAWLPFVRIDLLLLDLIYTLHGDNESTNIMGSIIYYKELCNTKWNI